MEQVPTTFLEEARALHEEIERYEAAAVRLLREPPQTSREKVAHSHVVAGLLDHVAHAGTALAALYSDETLARRRAELAELSGAASTASATPGTDAAIFAAFDARLARVRAAHERRRSAAVAAAEGAEARGAGAVLAALEDAAYAPAPGPTPVELAPGAAGRVRFAGAERGGRCLDLAAPFAQYQNVDEALRDTRFISYLTGLCGLARTLRDHPLPDEGDGENEQDGASTSAPARVRVAQEISAVVPVLGAVPAPGQLLGAGRAACAERDARARAYITALVAYLVDFCRRAQPLFDVDGKRAALEREWTARLQPVARPLDAPGMAQEQEGDDGEGDEMHDGEERETKAEKELKCELCDKTFAKATVLRGHQQSRAHRERAEKYARAVTEWVTRTWTPAAADVHVAAGLLGELCDVVHATAEYVSAKQARNTREIDADAAAAADGENSDGDEDGAEDAEDRRVAQIAAALAREDADGAEEGKRRRAIENYPVDAAGQPIPYWMYKLDGLGVEYRCEICGNAAFRGRRAFEQHFQDAQHTQGLRLLGIDNSLAFYDITRIADALALAERLRRDQHAAEWRADSDEECEDADGNVYSRKMYHALLRQGIIHK